MICEVSPEMAILWWNRLCENRRANASLLFQPDFDSCGEGFEQLLPDVGFLKYQPVCLCCLGVIRGGLFRFPVLEEDGALTKREETWSPIRSCNADGAGMVPQGSIVKPGEAPNAKVDAGADRNGPQDAMLAELEFAPVTLGKESLNVPLTYAGKEENSIKIALAGQFRFSLWQVGILGQFAGREGTQSHNRHAGVFGKGFQGV